MEAWVIIFVDFLSQFVLIILGLWIGHNFQFWKSLFHFGWTFTWRRNSRNKQKECSQSNCCSRFASRGTWFFLVLFFILTIVQICLVCVSFGKKLHDLPVTIFNGEQPPDLSQLFIDQIDNYLINYRESCDFDIAYNEVRQAIF